MIAWNKARPIIYILLSFLPKFASCPIHISLVITGHKPAVCKILCVFLLETFKIFHSSSFPIEMGYFYLMRTLLMYSSKFVQKLRLIIHLIIDRIM
jgi:hypothetical protein